MRLELEPEKMMMESSFWAELPSVLSELRKENKKQQREVNILKKGNGTMTCWEFGSLPGTEDMVEVAVTGVTTALAMAA